MYIVCGLGTECFHVKASGMYSNHCVLRDNGVPPPSTAYESFKEELRRLTPPLRPYIMQARRSHLGRTSCTQGREISRHEWWRALVNKIPFLARTIHREVKQVSLLPGSGKGERHHHHATSPRAIMCHHLWREPYQSMGCPVEQRSRFPCHLASVTNLVVGVGRVLLEGGCHAAAFLHPWSCGYVISM
jgi:hypothetical protein